MSTNSTRKPECVTWPTLHTLTDRDEDQLLLAVCTGDVRKVRNILKSEKTPRNLLTADADGWTAVHEACYYGQAECLKLLFTGDEALMQSAIFFQEVKENIITTPTHPV